MVAERFGDPSFQSRLVVLHDKQVVTVFIADLLANLALCENRVAGDDRAVEWQALQQHQRGADLVFVGRDNEVADDGTQIGRECGQHVDGFVVEAATALERLAVDRDIWPGVAPAIAYAPRTRASASASSDWKK